MTSDQRNNESNKDSNKNHGDTEFGVIKPSHDSKTKEYLGIYCRGLAMGAADIVPGVSGGTIALITGIYDRFINSLKSVGTAQTLHEVKDCRWSALFQRTDALFLVCLFSGILTAIVGLASGITYLMEHHPHPLWAFFLGLVIASALVLGRDLVRREKLKFTSLLMLIIGFIAAFLLGRMTPTDFEVQYWHFFAGGAVAICAMILPGISGSFLLLMLGLYGSVLTAIHEFAFVKLGLFTAGCAVGLLSFSHFLSWCLGRFPQGSHAFLIGLMLGSLEKIWPWKEVVSTRVKSDGQVVPLLEKAVSPLEFERIYAVSANIEVSVFTFVLAIGCIFLLGRKEG